MTPRSSVTFSERHLKVQHVIVVLSIQLYNELSRQGIVLSYAQHSRIFSFKVKHSVNEVENSGAKGQGLYNNAHLLMSR